MIQHPEQVRAAFYIRLSREDDGEGLSQSVQNQQSLLLEFARQNGLVHWEFYMDDGYSGTNFDRPDFQRMIADIEAKRIDLVVTKDLSRLGRDYILTGHYMERYFPEHGVRYISLLDGIDTGVESTANEITPFRAILNDLYAKDISKKIKSVKRNQQRNGLFIGGKALFGYQKDPNVKNHLVVDPVAAQVVRKIFSMALSGMSCHAIAMELNRTGVETPARYAGQVCSRPGMYAGLWSSERISEMLQNETYIGNLVQGRRRKINYKSQKCRLEPPENWVVVPGTHGAIISPEEFQAVQKLLDSRRKTRTRHYDFLLKGLLFCKECGHPLGVINRKNRQSQDVLYLICRTYQRFTKASACTSHTIREQAVTAAVLETLRQRFPLEPQDFLEAAKTLSVKKPEPVCIQRQKLEAKLDRAYLDRLDGLLSEGDFRRIYEKLSAQREQLEALQSNSSESPAPWDRCCAFCQAGFSNRELLVSLIDRIEMDENREITIYFRCCDPEKTPIP